MKIDIQFTEGELQSLKHVLGENLNIRNEEDLIYKLNLIAQASFSEYVDMIGGAGMPTKASDMMQDRIVYLIEHYFKRFPNENELSQVFNITLTKSRSILTNLKATHRNKLKDVIKSEISSFLATGRDMKNDYWEFQSFSKVIIQELNDLITLKSPGKALFKPKLDSAGKYLLHVDTYTFLKSIYLK